MTYRRPIRTEEKDLILHILGLLKFDTGKYPFNEMVEEYGDIPMGSIGLSTSNHAVYGGDLIQAEYIDSDNTPVVITLTHDTENRLLDLDFWKTDNTSLVTFPKPENIIPRNL